jgi:hypothetical protein
MQRLTPALACLALLSGCGDQLPPVEKIAEHRLLSAPVHVVGPYDPEAVPDDRVRAQAMPGETVEVRPFAVSPEGVVDPDDLDLRWIACELFPGRGEFACILESFPLSLDTLPACDFPSLNDVIAAGEPIAIETPCLLDAGTSPTFDVPVSEGVLSGADLELTAIGSTPGGTSTERCADELLSGQANVPNDCIYGVQTVSIGPKLRLLDWLVQLGFDVGDLEVPDPDDIDEPDLHPVVTSFRVSVLGDDGEPVGEPIDVPLGGEFEARAGQRLRIDTTSPESDLQDYLIPINGGTAFEDGVEEYTGQWFITWGDLLSPISLDAESYNEWTLEATGDDAATAPGDVAHLYYVVRDGRNGSASWWFTVRFS